MQRRSSYHGFSGQSLYGVGRMMASHLDYLVNGQVEGILNCRQEEWMRQDWANGHQVGLDLCRDIWAG